MGLGRGGDKRSIRSGLRFARTFQLQRRLSGWERENNKTKNKRITKQKNKKITKQKTRITKQKTRAYVRTYTYLLTYIHTRTGN